MGILMTNSDQAPFHHPPFYVLSLCFRRSEEEQPPSLSLSLAFHCSVLSQWEFAELPGPGRSHCKTCCRTEITKLLPSDRFTDLKRQRAQDGSKTHLWASLQNQFSQSFLAGYAWWHQETGVQGLAVPSECRAQPSATPGPG